MRKTDAGIAVVVIGLAIALLVNPPIGPSGNSSNETAAIATLRNLGSAQSMFQGRVVQGRRWCDLDGDGIGEYGTFGEMTGNDGQRADPSGALRRAPVLPPELSSSLASVDERGIVTKSGYCFSIWLPGAGSGAVHEGKAKPWARGGRPAEPGEGGAASTRPGSPFSGPVNIDGSESRWCAYAWPLARGISGNRAFFTDQSGDIWWTFNSGTPDSGPDAPGPYQGVFTELRWDAAMPARGKPGWSSADDGLAHVGRDGNEWRPAK